MFNLVYIIVYIVTTLFFYSIFRIIYLKRKKKKNSKIYWLGEFLIVCLVVYVAAMATILFLNRFTGLDMFLDKGLLNPIERIKENWGVNFIPFKSIYEIYTYSMSSSVVFKNIAGNIILFIPIGLIMGVLWKRWRKVISMLLFSLLVPCGIEFIQLFIGRSVDVDDVILNFVGFMIGFLLSLLFVKLFPKFHSKYISQN